MIALSNCYHCSLLHILRIFNLRSVPSLILKMFGFESEVVLTTFTHYTWHLLSCMEVDSTHLAQSHSHSMLWAWFFAANMYLHIVITD